MNWRNFEMVKENDWVETSEDIHVKGLSGTHTIKKGELGRALKVVDNKVNVLFGIALGVHAIDKDKLVVKN